MKLLLAVLLASFCARADAAAGRTAPELLAHPWLPVYPSPFYAHADFPQLLSAPLLRDAAPDLSILYAQQAAAKTALLNAQPTVADITPIKLSAVSQIPVLPPSAIDETRGHFGAGLGNLLARRPLPQEQSAAVASIAKAAFDAKDVTTLTQLALLTSREKNPAMHDLLVEALNVLRNRVLTAESVEAGRGLSTLGREALSSDTRGWIAGQLGKRVGAKYLPRVQQLELPLGK